MGITPDVAAVIRFGLNFLTALKIPFSNFGAVFGVKTFLARVVADPMRAVKDIDAEEEQIVKREPAQMLDSLAFGAELEGAVKERGLFGRSRAGNRRMRIAGLRTFQRGLEFG